MRSRSAGLDRLDTVSAEMRDRLCTLLATQLNSARPSVVVVVVVVLVVVVV